MSAPTGAAMRGKPLLQAERLYVRHRLSARRWMQAVVDLDLTLAAGEALGVVGESGSGKSTLARALLALLPPASGRVLLDGEDLARLSTRDLRARRRHMQMVFQDPHASLDPRMDVRGIVGEPLLASVPHMDAATRRAHIVEALSDVQLDETFLTRHPHQLSGGQAQRVGIARALVAGPRLIVCDEPVASLDVSIRAQVLDLIARLRRERDLALIFIAHDLPSVRRLCDRVLVLYLGRVMEVAPAAVLEGHALHPYTQALLAAAPLLDPVAARARRAAAPPVSPDVPSPLAPPSGCVFRTRCPYAIDRCTQEVPLLRPIGLSQVACHRAEEIAALGVTR